MRSYIGDRRQQSEVVSEGAKRAADGRRRSQRIDPRRHPSAQDLEILHTHLWPTP
ncbi:hypothetical protein NLM33_38760 [Bradyrhizobium sp. CCGUVB1N3]|nr:MULTISPECIES: hypothetical protein [unclassified Bradyrhizobium]MCP3476162.1 hypothetical protein [Bradyrhizobium sp. CCGUVB1N3]